VILHAFVVAACQTNTLHRPGAWRTGVAVHYGLSALAAAAALAGFWAKLAPARSVSLFATGTLSVSFALAALLSARILRRERPRTEHERAEQRGLLIPLGITLLLAAVMMLLQTGRVPFAELVAVVIRSAPLFFLLFSAYYEDRLAFYDRFLKGGVLLVVAALLLAGALVLAERLLAPVPLGASRPWVLALALLPVAGALPWLAQVLGRFVDARWLGRSWRSTDAVERFLAALQGATDEASLLGRTEAELARLFRAPAQVLDDPPRPPLPGVLEAELLDLRVRVGPRPDRLPLLSEDAALLSTLCTVAASALANARLQERERALRLHASEAELKALHAQIRPHFLFNALNAVAGLIRKDPALADQTVERLADVLRYTLRRSESGFATLGDELEFVRAYLEVERARFGERLSFALEVEPGLESVRIPTMTLQTLVENAVKHGIAARRDGGRVTVRAEAVGGHLQVRVEDDGPGPAPGRRSLDAGGPGGYGLDNLGRRLQACYGGAASVDLRRDETRGVTVASVRLPVEMGAVR
jgi:anti-sigma regulatory factor (Ser/Thr protein kinase)/drug/metabolite transporter (DMT)-like permease